MSQSPPGLTRLVPCVTVAPRRAGGWIAVDVREWRTDGDSRDMAQLASALWPAGLHPGGLGWCLATDQLASRILLARGGGDLRGWAGVSLGELALQVPQATARPPRR